MPTPTAEGRCIRLDPDKGYRLCRLPVAPGGMLLCAKHRAEAELRYREERHRPNEDMREDEGRDP